MDEEIIHYVRKAYNVLIGERTAEEIKMEIGYALIDHPEVTMDVRGRDMVTGLPKRSSYHRLKFNQPLKSHWNSYWKPFELHLKTARQN